MSRSQLIDRAWICNRQERERRRGGGGMGHIWDDTDGGEVGGVAHIWVADRIFGNGRLIFED